MTLPFTADQFFDLFVAYNRALWPAAVALWIYAAVGAVALAAHWPRRDRWMATMLAVQWAWAGVAYHAAFFTAINPAAWLFSALFVGEAILWLWSGAMHGRLHFAGAGSTRHIVAWTLIAYALAYPLVVQLDGHRFPAMPTFGLPCPTTLLTIGFLFAVDPPLPRLLAIVPIAWAFIGGSAALLLGVRADLMLWASGALLAAYVVTRRRAAVIA